MDQLKRSRSLENENVSLEARGTPSACNLSEEHNKSVGYAKL